MSKKKEKYDGLPLLSSNENSPIIKSSMMMDEDVVDIDSLEYLNELRINNNSNSSSIRNNRLNNSSSGVIINGSGESSRSREELEQQEDDEISSEDGGARLIESVNNNNNNNNSSLNNNSNKYRYKNNNKHIYNSTNNNSSSNNKPLNSSQDIFNKSNYHIDSDSGGDDDNDDDEEVEIIKSYEQDNSNQNRSNNKSYDGDLFSLYSNQRVLYQNYFTDSKQRSRILVIGGEKDVIRLTFNELLYLIKEIKINNLLYKNNSNNNISVNSNSGISSNHSSNIINQYSNNESNNNNSRSDHNNLNLKIINNILNQLCNNNSTNNNNNNNNDNSINNNNNNNNEKVYWIDIFGLQDDEIITLCKELDIHHLNTEDILEEDSAEKCEQHSSYHFIATSEMIQSVNKDLNENNFYMLVFHRLIFVLHDKELDCFSEVFKSFRYLNNNGKQLTSSQWVMCSFFEAVTELANIEADKLLNEVDALDDLSSLSEDIGHQDLYIRIGKATRRNTTLLSNLFNKEVILSSLLRQSEFNMETKIYLKHVMDRSKRLKEKIKLSEDLLENFHNSYIGKISLLLNEESHELTVSMKRFANWSLISYPLILIATMYGMNIRMPGVVYYLDDQDDGSIYFYLILLLMLLLSILTSYLYKKIGWLD